MDSPVVSAAREPQPFVILGYEPIENCFPRGGRAVFAIVGTVDAVAGEPTHERLLTFKRIVGLTETRSDEGWGPNYAAVLRTLGVRNPLYKGRGFIITHTLYGGLWGRKFGLNPDTGKMRPKAHSRAIPEKIPVDRILILRVPNPV